MKFTSLRPSLLAPALPVTLALVLSTLCSVPAAEPKTGGESRRGRADRDRSTESVRSGTTTAPDGQVAITSSDRKWDEKTGTGTLNEAAATPDGRVSSREANLTRNPDGSITARGTFTDFDGRSYNYTEIATGPSAGAVVRGKMIDEDGAVSTYETTTNRAPDRQTKRTTVITRADGSKETRVEVLDRPKVVAGI
ncbi:MAG: hypothetical protein HZC55_22380 [Verrucomicrobia bacterium]|nr:hypothetical protein [Verrucomicrobiota bacterium]